MPAIEEKVLDKILNRRQEQNLRNRAENANRISAAGRSRPRSKGIVGGFFRSYKFMYERGASIAHGSFSVEFDVNNYVEFDATMVIIEPAEVNSGQICERIVEETEKLAGHHESVVEAYFSAYCHQIKKYIVVYERFDGYFNENANKIDNPFFANETKSELTDFWRNKVRSLVDVLCTARRRNVVHGGFSNATSYVVSAGTLKIINVARYDGQSNRSDLQDLNNYIRSDTFCMASTSTDWEALTYLINSKKTEEGDWSSVVLKHPILLDADGKLRSYEEVEVYMWSELNRATRRMFANAMYLKMPWMYMTTPQGASKPIKAEIKHFLDLTNNQLHATLYHSAHFSGIIYADVIQLVRNIINHLDHNTEVHWTAEQIVNEISRLFPGFMSMAYSIANVTGADWQVLFRATKTRKY